MAFSIRSEGSSSEVICCSVQGTCYPTVHHGMMQVILESECFLSTIEQSCLLFEAGISAALRFAYTIMRERESNLARLCAVLFIVVFMVVLVRMYL